MKFKFSLILILLSFTGFSQIEPKIYICSSTNISELKFEKEVYYFENIKKIKECNVLIFKGSVIELYNNQLHTKWDVIDSSKKNNIITLVTNLNGKESDIFTIYPERIERETFVEDISAVYKYSYDSVLVESICK
jgi:hypothetical protein